MTIYEEGCRGTWEKFPVVSLSGGRGAWKNPMMNLGGPQKFDNIGDETYFYENDEGEIEKWGSKGRINSFSRSCAIVSPPLRLYFHPFLHIFLFDDYNF